MEIDLKQLTTAVHRGTTDKQDTQQFRFRCRDYSLAELETLLKAFLVQHDNASVQYECRWWRVFTRYFGWSVPTLPLADTILDFVQEGILLEIGAGLGLWSLILQRRATERQLPITVVTTTLIEGWYSEEDMDSAWYPSERLSAEEALAKYPAAKCLFCCWGARTLPLTISTARLVVIGEATEATDYYEGVSHQLVAEHEIPLLIGNSLSSACRFYMRS